MADFGRAPLCKGPSTAFDTAFVRRERHIHRSDFSAAKDTVLSPHSHLHISLGERQRVTKEAVYRQYETFPPKLTEEAIDDLNGKSIVKQQDQETKEQDEDKQSTLEIDELIDFYIRAVTSGNGRTEHSIAGRSNHRDSDQSLLIDLSPGPTRQSTPTRSSIAELSPSIPLPPMSRRAALFVASLGNPNPYQSTRHSAGHIVLHSLAKIMSFPPLTKSKPYANGNFSSSAADKSVSLWQSPAYMNVSGGPLLKAYRQFLSTVEADSVTGLMVLHDEMEASPGQIKMRRGGDLSAKGHRGILSVHHTLASADLLKPLGRNFVKVGIGIGRPAGKTREKNDVSEYVLGQVTSVEREGLDKAAQQMEGIIRDELIRLSES